MMSNQMKVMVFIGVFLCIGAFFFLPFLDSFASPHSELNPKEVSLNLQGSFPKTPDVPSHQSGSQTEGQSASDSTTSGQKQIGTENTNQLESQGTGRDTPMLNEPSTVQEPAQGPNSDTIGTLTEPSSYRMEMTSLISAIRNHAREKNSSFELISNNGLDLLNSADSSIGTKFLNSLDAVNLEELYYGWEMRDDVKTPTTIQQELLRLIQQPLNRGLPVFNIDYAKQKAHVDDAYTNNTKSKVIPFVANRRELDSIPAYPAPIYQVSNKNVNQLKDAQNFMILLNPQQYKSKEEYLKALSNTDYDVLIIDLCFWGEPLRKADVERLKVKKNGGKRLVISYMSIGEAEDYRIYWQDTWSDYPPDWIAEENEDWEGNYKVRYWSSAWHDIVYQSRNSYLNKIIEAGFNGVFLDVIDAYQYFEEAR